MNYSLRVPIINSYEFDWPITKNNYSCFGQSPNIYVVVSSFVLVIYVTEVELGGKWCWIKWGGNGNMLGNKLRTWGEVFRCVVDIGYHFLLVV
jgi:hypothetical protein